MLVPFSRSLLGLTEGMNDHARLTVGAALVRCNVVRCNVVGEDVVGEDVVRKGVPREGCDVPACDADFATVNAGPKEVAEARTTGVAIQRYRHGVTHIGPC